MIVKIVRQLANNEDNHKFFESDIINVTRSEFMTDSNKGTVAKDSDATHAPTILLNKIILHKESDGMKDGDRCLVITLENSKGFLSIATNCPTYIINSAGKTVDTFRTKGIN